MSLYGLVNATEQAFTGLLHRPSWQLSLPIIIELAYYLFVVVGLIRYVIRRSVSIEAEKPYLPKVSCLITSYSEGEAVSQTLHTLCEQTYEGYVEIILVVDGALQNKDTYQAGKRFERQYASFYRSNRRIIILPKWQRGGRVSSLNAGFLLSSGEIVMALDGDTSFDNDMIQKGVRHFSDPRVAAVSGTLTVRNANYSFSTRMQSIEYQLALLLAKIGLSEFNVLNNVAGAFGIFRRTVIQKVGGWSTGSAEDLDMTLRIKQYIVRNKLKIKFEPLAVGHTDVPETWVKFLMQRVRWDGDLMYIYLRKHRHSFNPRLIGWPNFLMMLWSGLLFQLVAPFVITAYLVWSAFMTPLPEFIAINLLFYFYYLAITLVLYVCYLIVSSRNVWSDLKNLLQLPLFVGFIFISRIWSVVAILNELWRRGHEETSMAPWWVLKRTIKF